LIEQARHETLEENRSHNLSFVGSLSVVGVRGATKPFPSALSV